MIESPLQILRERVAENVTDILNKLTSPCFWIKAFFMQFRK